MFHILEQELRYNPIAHTQLKQLLRRAFKLWLLPDLPSEGYWYTLVTYPESQVVACGQMKHNILWNFAVDPAYRQRGLGRILLQYIHRRHPSMTWKVEGKNHSAQRFYQRCGGYMVSYDKQQDLQLWKFGSVMEG